MVWLSLLALAASAVTLGVMPASQAVAQEERETRQVQALRERVFQALGSAQEKLEEDDYVGAQRDIDEVRRRVDDLNTYEQAQLWNFTGFIRVQQEDLEGAVEAFERVVAMPDIPGGLLEESLNTLIQLSLATEQYEKTLEYGQRWLEITDTPGPQPYYRLAVANYQLERYQRAVERLNEAVDLARADGEERVREEYYVLLRASYFQLEDTDNLLDTLEYMVQRWPNKDYWIHLSAIYGEKGEERKQLAILESIYEDGLLNRENEYVQLAQLYIQAGGPYKGAQILERHLEEGDIEENERHYRLLAQAWMSAQDDRRSIGPLREAARRADDGQLFVQLAQSYLNLDEHGECVESARAGLSRGGVRREDTANVVLGMCLFELERYDAAKDAFRAAARDDRSRRTANQWIQFIDRELSRQEDLRQAMERG